MNLRIPTESELERMGWCLIFSLCMVLFYQFNKGLFIVTSVIVAGACLYSQLLHRVLEPDRVWMRIQHIPCDCGKSDWYEYPRYQKGKCGECEFDYANGIHSKIKGNNIQQYNDLDGFLNCQMFFCSNQKCQKCSWCMRNQVWKRKEQRKQKILDSLDELCNVTEPKVRSIIYKLQHEDIGNKWMEEHIPSEQPVPFSDV